MPRRKKVSTTISDESYGVLRSLIHAGKAQNLAQALDFILDEFRRADNRRRLEEATARYYESLSPEDVAQENELGEALSRAAGEVNFDE